MSDGYLIRHRGRQEGPFSLDTLQQRLTDGEIGLWHEVLVDGEWMTVQDFLKKNEGQRKQEEAAAQQRAEEDATRRREEERRRQEEDDRAGMEEELERQREEIANIRSNNQQLRNQPSFIPPPPMNMQMAQPYGMAYPPVPRTSAAAVWSLVLGILGLCTCLLAIPAIICGHVGLSSIRNSRGQVTGEGLCIAGLVMGYLAVGCACVYIALVVASVIAIPKF